MPTNFACDIYGLKDVQSYNGPTMCVDMNTGTRKDKNQINNQCSDTFSQNVLPLMRNRLPPGTIYQAKNAAKNACGFSSILPLKGGSSKVVKKMRTKMRKLQKQQQKTQKKMQKVAKQMQRAQKKGRTQKRR
jgi:hypothetical protein